MAAFTSEEIIQATGARLLKPAASVSFSDVCTDTRAIAKGSLFVAFKGTSFNGHDFVDKALAAGAAGAVVSEVRPEYEGLTAPILSPPTRSRPIRTWPASTAAALPSPS